MISTDISVWISALLTIFVYSYYVNTKQNVFFRFAQSTVIGLSLGYIITFVIVKNLDALVLTKLSMGNIVYIIPLVLGLMMYGRFVPGYTYLSRFPIAIIVSSGLGLGAIAAFEAQVFNNITAIANLSIIGVDLKTGLNNIIYLIGLFSAIYYFFFTLDIKITNKLKPISTLGRYYLMVHFGTRFATTVLNRLSLFLGRLQLVLFQWLGLG